MAAKIVTIKDQESHNGRTVDSIVRRLYGRSAEVWRPMDPNSPQHIWTVVTPCKTGGWNVLGVISVHQES